MCPSSFYMWLETQVETSLKFGEKVFLSTESSQKSFRSTLREVRNDLTITFIPVLSQR